MSPGLTPERKIPIRRRVRRQLRRAKLRLKLQAIGGGGWIEDRRHHLATAIAEKKSEIGSTIEQERTRRKTAGIIKDHQQAEEFLNQHPDLLTAAQERYPQLIESAQEIGEKRVATAQRAGRMVGRIVLGGIHGLWEVGYSSGAGLRVIVEAVKEARRKPR